MRNLQDDTQNNAMSEIALALAMAFFSIMILALVSMGAGEKVSGEQTPSAENGFKVISTEPNADPAMSSKGTAPREAIIIYFKGRYLDAQFHETDPAKMSGQKELFLAVDPDAAMSEIVQARNGLKQSEITVVTLDEAWMTALKGARQ